MKTFADYGIAALGQTGEFDITCPRCSPSRRNKRARCLSVNTEKGLWLCHHCGWSGSIERGEIDAPALNRRYQAPTLPTRGALPRDAVDWFALRGIDEDVLRRNRISYGAAYFPQAEDRRGAILFPYYRGSELINVKYRTRDKLFRMHGGAERTLYGLSDIGRTTIIVEGEIDKLSCEMAGYRNCVSVPDGAPPPSAKGYATKFSYLEADAELISQVETWVIAVDNDAPGKKLEAELVRRFGPERCKRVEWPAGCKDANEVLVQQGRETLKACIEDAKAYPIEGLISPEDVKSLYDDLYVSGLSPGAHTGWESLSKLYTVRQGEWTLISGIPGHGKSNFLDALIVNLIKYHGWNFAICSPENQPIQRHMAALAEKFMEKRFTGHNRMTKEEAEVAFWQLQDHVSFILPEEPTIDAILDRAKIAVARKGITGLVIDPWNEIEHSRPTKLTETEYISQSLATFRRFARTHQIHLWLVAHPTKMRQSTHKTPGTEKEPVPSPYDVSGSSHWRNKADNCITIWRDFSGDSNVVQVHVQKIRFREVGSPGLAELIYDRDAGGIFRDTGCWSSLGREVSVVPADIRYERPDTEDTHIDPPEGDEDLYAELRAWRDATGPGTRQLID